MSEWGAPLTHDGTLPTEAVLWVDKMSDITDDGWESILASRQINWVLIPLSTE